MSLLTSLKADATTIGNAIASLFSSLQSKLVSFFSVGASAIATSIQKQLPEAGEEIITFIESSAMDAVTAAEVTPGTGQVKMLAAIAALTADLATKGIALAETELRSILENALLQFKAATAPVVPAAGTAPATTSAV